MTGFALRWHAIPLAVTMTDGVMVRKGGPIYGTITTRAGTTAILPYAQADSAAEGPFRALEVHGPLDFQLTGVLSRLLNPLAQADISVFTLSTFDTDWILVPADRVDAASRALSNAGHTIEEQA